MDRPLSDAAVIAALARAVVLLNGDRQVDAGRQPITMTGTEGAATFWPATTADWEFDGAMLLGDVGPLKYIPLDRTLVRVGQEYRLEIELT